MIAEVARNLTAEGREVNLWQIMTKVNSTVRENPNSSLARLMHRDGKLFGRTDEDMTEIINRSSNFPTNALQ